VHFHKYYLDNFSNIDSSKCIIDAGAYIGDSALILSEYTNDKVYCFEPTCEAFRLLNKTIELNNLRNIVPIKMGLSNKEYEDDIYVHLSASSMNSFRDNGTNCEKISLTTIDKYVKQNNLQVGLIKADIEGLETLMLEGAKETICSQKPALIISIYHSAHDFFKIKPMIESWNLGYKFKITPPPRTPCVCGNLSFRGGF
jgi:FkbM family methyltransferase